MRRRRSFPRAARRSFIEPVSVSVLQHLQRLDDSKIMSSCISGGSHSLSVPQHILDARKHALLHDFNHHVVFKSVASMLSLQHELLYLATTPCMQINQTVITPSLKTQISVTGCEQATEVVCKATGHKRKVKRNPSCSESNSNEKA